MYIHYNIITYYISYDIITTKQTPRYISLLVVVIISIISLNSYISIISLSSNVNSLKMRLLLLAFICSILITFYVIPCNRRILGNNPV